MAISSLEQRLRPLEETGCWLPFGALRIPPWLEHEILEEDSLPTVTRGRRRLRTWAGYCPHRLARFVSQQPGEKAEVHSGDRSPESDDGSRGSRTDSLQLPDRSKVESSKAAGIRSAGIDSDCETQTPDSRSSSFSPCAWEENNWDGTFHAPGHARKGDAPSETVTTLMVQNLSRTLTRRGLLDVLNGAGFAERYDFVHLPQTFRTGRNKGFAFINFCSPEAAKEFSGRFLLDDGTPIKDKMWRVAPADVQGFEANAAAADSKKMVRIRNNACRPLLLAPRRSRADTALPTSQAPGR